MIRAPKKTFHSKSHSPNAQCTGSSRDSSKKTLGEDAI